MFPLLSRSRSKNQPAGIPASDHEARVQEIGRELLEASHRHEKGVLSARFWSDRLLDWTMKDEAFKVQLFRFVDAFPVLNSPAQIHAHLVDYLSQPGVTLPPFLATGLKAGGALKGAFARTIAGQIRSMAEKFIAGTDARSALPRLKNLHDRGLAFSVDLLGEACVSEEEAAAYRERYFQLLNELPAAANWPPDERIDADNLGPIPRTNVSIKISSLHARTDPTDFEGTLSSLTEALQPLLETAVRNGVFINFDMEHFALKELTLALFMRCRERIDFDGGLALQAYLKSGDEDARRIIEWAKSLNKPIVVRLVKGAYWDYEVIQAEQHGWPIPVWSRKTETDACFERMTRAFLAASPRQASEGGVQLALGSHNLRSIAVGLAALEERKLPQNALEIQMLHGMAEPIKSALLDRGLRVREYLPVGEMIPGMAYLVRRLLENTSNESWLRAGFLDHANPDKLLASPHRDEEGDPGVERIRQAPERHALTGAVEGVGNGRPFFSEPLRDFSDASQRDRFARAVADGHVRIVPNDGTREEARQAVAEMVAGFPAWRDTDPVERARLLCQTAARIRDRRDELAASIARENGKGWRDADADVCEAIDFLKYYARLAPPLFRPERLGQFVGEWNEQFYQPRGVAAVISPWNFPLAICCGMTAAALATGNTVVVKPAEQTPGIAREMVEILWEAGVPRTALSFVAGPGETVGAELVRDPRVALIAFTGSKSVGLEILQAASRVDPAQTHIKRVICEMGGKNSLLIDASADLDEAVLGVRGSAFGYQGQKCSACSRVIVVEDIFEPFLKRLIASTRSLTIGDPLDPGTDIGPVIDAEAREKIRHYIDVGRKEGHLELAMEVPEGLQERVGKPYVGPHIFSGIESHHQLAREEIFGPVLAVMKVRSFEEALELANGTGYKLTGGVYSRKPSHLERARREFRVGNLYLNRNITGALVGRQPFGGFGLSGIGSKAGGKDYLLQFVEPRVVTENTMRRGFAPDVA